MSEPAPPPTWRERLDLIARPPTLTPTQLAVGAVAAIAIVAAGWFLLRQPSGPPPEATLPRAHATASTTSQPAQLIVDAAGAVQSPGVYKLKPGSRVNDLIDAAGGPTDDADLDRVNLAAPLSDGVRVYVPKVGEATPSSDGGGGDAATPDQPLDLNTATLDQLDGLPGIGPSTAKAIIDERTKRGGFTSVDDLLSVRGIGPAKLDAIRDLVTV